MESKLFSYWIFEYLLFVDLRFDEIFSNVSIDSRLKAYKQTIEIQIQVYIEFEPIVLSLNEFYNL